MSDDSVARLARWTSVVLMAVALFFTLTSGKTIVALLLIGYAGVSQFFPGIVLGLFWNRASRAGVFSGLVVGIIAVALLILSGRDPFMGLNAGFAALILNFAVTVVVSLLSRSQARGIDSLWVLTAENR